MVTLKQVIRLTSFGEINKMALILSSELYIKLFVKENTNHEKQNKCSFSTAISVKGDYRNNKMKIVNLTFTLPLTHTPPHTLLNP